MQSLDDSEIDERVRRYYNALRIAPRFPHMKGGAEPLRAWKRWIPAAAVAVVILGGTAIAARDGLQATAMKSIEHALSIQFTHPVPEAKQVPVGLETATAQLAQMGLELPRGLPGGAKLASVRTVNGNAGWFIVAYRVRGRSGEAVFSITSTRTTASAGGNAALDDPAVPMQTRFASWETATERVVLVSRGDALSDREISKIKETSEQPR